MRRHVAIKDQSPEILSGVAHAVEVRTGEQVDKYDRVGAGDQGMMIGFACNETPELMPLPISLAHGLCRRLSEARKSGEIPWLLPDGKSQVTVEYHRGRPARVDTVVVSTQHLADVPNEEIEQTIIESVVRRVISDDLLDEETAFLINPSGRFEIGGPMADAGLTGRRSSSTRMVEWLATAEEPSRARTPRRSTDPLPMPPVTSPRTWSQRASPIASRSRSRTQLEKHAPCRS